MSIRPSRRAIVPSFLILLALVGCKALPVAATIAPIPSITPNPSATFTPEPFTPTPDPDLATARAADVFCETIPDKGTALGTAALALANAGSTMTVDEAAQLGWYLSVDTQPGVDDPNMVAPQHVFTDPLSQLQGSVKFNYNNVAPGMEVCVSSSSLAAAMHEPRP